jgi:GntR family transcriptional regulator/MocR family aminotransferase
VAAAQNSSKAAQHGHEQFNPAGGYGTFKGPLSMSFVIPLSRNGGSPLTRQIYNWFRQAILQGTMRSGERLPSTRELAEQLHVSRTVAVLAYEQLLAEGFVAGRAGSGTYVSEGLATAHRSTQAKLAKVKLSIFGHSVEAATSKVNYPSNRTTSLHYDFAYGRSDVEIFPFEMWRRMLLRHARKAPVRELDYGPTAGSLALREAIAVHLRRSRAVACDASQVIVVSGSQQALDLIARVLIERGDRVAIEDPIYQGTSEILRTAGGALAAGAGGSRGAATCQSAEGCTHRVRNAIAPISDRGGSSAGSPAGVARLGEAQRRGRG